MIRETREIRMPLSEIKRLKIAIKAHDPDQDWPHQVTALTRTQLRQFIKEKKRHMLLDHVLAKKRTKERK